MGEYIERKKAIDAIVKAVGTGFAVTAEDLAGILDDLPATDVAPVVHGRWISKGEGYGWHYECSVCGWKDGFPFEGRHNFYPNCGAKMDLEELQ